MAIQPQYGQQNTGYAQQAVNVETKHSRISSDVERLLGAARSINSARDRVLKHTAALGYFPDSPPPDSEKVSPISTNMQTALGDLDRAIDGMLNALALFD